MQISKNIKLIKDSIFNTLLLIPLDTSVQDISKFGDPQIVRHSGQRTDAIWKNVVIFGGYKFDLTAMFWSTLFFRRRLRHIYSYLDSLDKVEELKSHLDNYFGLQHKKKVFSKYTFNYKWVVNKCKIRIGQDDRFGDFYYLTVDR